MRVEATKKAFRAVGPQVVEKQFVTTDAKLPDGWFETVEAALAAYQPVTAQEVQEAPAPRRGRPRKE